MRQSPKKIQALLATQLFLNVGFYPVAPFIAVEFSNNLGASGVVVGLVLGVRTLNQQRVFLLGGGLVDRFGVIRVLLVGVILRVVDFPVIGLATSASMMFVSVAPVGFAVVLLSPAVESLLAGGGAELGK